MDFEVERAENDLTWLFNDADGEMGVSSGMGAAIDTLTRGGHAPRTPTSSPDYRALAASERYRRIRARLNELDPMDQLALREAYLVRDLRGGLSMYGRKPGVLWACMDVLAAYRADGGKHPESLGAWLAGLVQRATCSRKKRVRDEARVQVERFGRIGDRTLRTALGRYLGTEVPEPRRMTVRELSDETGLSEVAVRQRLSRASVRRVRSGRAVQVSEDDWSAAYSG